jgi:PleD family two-component response regulator
MKKVLIAINNDFIRETYYEVLLKEQFEVFKEKSGKKALEIIKEQIPDAAIIDTGLTDLDGFKLVAEVKKDPSLKKIPIIFYAQYENKKDRQKAIDLEAKDFVSAAEVTPIEIIRRVKIVLGEQRSYKISIQKNMYNAKELITDLGYTYDFKCQKCGGDLLLHLIRDLSKGKNYFIVSVICPECSYK